MKQSKVFTLYVGLNDKDTKKQVVPTKRAKEIVVRICGDCTISTADGHYTHEDGKEVTEKTLRVELFCKADNQIKSYCKQLKRALNQESIAVNTQVVQTNFI